ncbi:MAG: hypothetical protein H0V76_11130 [Blastocatellia bacterium]|nr:hypothetical protein [Blastocatellia bacterium]
MKKHFAGFALFTSIIVLTIAAFAYFGALSILRLPTHIYTEPKDCFALPPAVQKPLTFKVEAVQYDSDRQKMISRVSVRWNGFGSPPADLYLTQRVLTGTGRGSQLFLGNKTVTAPFQGERFAIVEFESDLAGSPIDPSENYYSEIAVSDVPLIRHQDTVEFSEPFQVLYSHGRNSKKMK